MAPTSESNSVASLKTLLPGEMAERQALERELRVRGTQPIKFGWGDKLAPRLGAAWNVLGNDKWVIRGSYSVFYDVMKYELPRGSFGADKYLVYYRAFDDPNFANYSANYLPGAILSAFDFRVPSLITQAGIPPIDPNLKPTREHEYTVATDYALKRDMLFSVRLTRKGLDRTIEDVGLPFADANGNVNEVFFISNPGFGISVDNFKANGLPPPPKAVRDYTGLEFRLDKRFSNNWYANVSYLYSRLYGNYSSLASTDENGRNSPNVNRFYDLPELQYDTRGRQTLGRLPTDRPNTFKAFAAYDFNYGLFGKRITTELGGSQYIYQGTPISTQLADLTGDPSTGLYDGAIVLPNGRGDLGRTPVFTQTDLLLTHRMPINERVSLRFSMNVLNLFNQATVTNRSGAYLRGATATDFDEFNNPATRIRYFASGYPNAIQAYLNSNGDWQQRFHDQRVSAWLASHPGDTAGAESYYQSFLNPFYNKPTEFQGPRTIRFSFDIQF